MMFVSHSPLEQRIDIVDKMRHSRHVLITELSMNSTTNESIYALTIGCCGEPHQALAAYNNVEMTTIW